MSVSMFWFDIDCDKKKFHFVQLVVQKKYIKRYDVMKCVYFITTNIYYLRLVYIRSTPPSATSVTHPSGYWPSHASFRCPQLRHVHGRWCVNEVARFKGSSCLFRDSASTAEYSSLSSALRSSVTGFVSFCSCWTMVMQCWLAFHRILPSGCSRCWILLLG